MSNDEKVHNAIIHAARKSVEVLVSGNKYEATYGHLPKAVVAELKKAGLVIVSEADLLKAKSPKIAETTY